MIHLFPNFWSPIAVIAGLLGSGEGEARQEQEEEEQREEGRKGQFQAQRGEALCEGEWQ